MSNQQQLSYKDSQGRTIHYKLVPCVCGCGELIKNRNKNGEVKYKHGHSRPDRKILSEGKMGDKNPMWKGDNIGYITLHTWVRTRLPKPKFCQDCMIKPPMDLANITGIYNRNLDNWKYLCRRCHMLGDGRMKNLKQYADAHKDCSEKGIW